MADDALVIFTPSGKRGRFAIGTPVLTAARQLGVDLDSVCGGRGICSKCQITPSYGEFSKHGVTVAAGRSSGIPCHPAAQATPSHQSMCGLSTADQPAARARCPAS